MAYLREEEINHIREKADIVDVIGQYIPLTHKGKNYVCTCPFHDDTHPSMSISTDKQIYKCFSCGAGGNVFTFVSNYEKISFIEAVYKVADYANVPIEHTLSVPEKKVDPHLQALYKTCQDTIEFTHYQLDTLDARHVKEYVTSRAISETIIKTFELGYNPPKDVLYAFLHAKKHTDEDIIGAGVCRMTPIGMKDVFADRMMIPIHNAFGDPVGFTARRIGNGEEAKYINTSQTDIYCKGQLLFNYHRVKPIAKRMQKVYLVEGAMDVLAFAKVALPNVVATLGTACTKEQLHLLKQLRVVIIVCYDGDQAGRNATYKFGKLACAAGLPFEIVDNRFGLDPDEVIDEFGKEELVSMANKTISWIDFLFNYLLTRYNLENYTQKKEFAVEMTKEINALQNDFEKDSYYIRLKEITDFDMRSVVHTKQREEEHYRQPTSNTSVSFPKSGKMHAEYEILSQMLNGVSASNYYKEELGYFKDDVCNHLALYIIDYYRTHATLSIAALLDEIKDAPTKSLLLDIANWDLAQDEVNMDVLREAIHKVKACFIDDKIELMNKRIHAMHDPMEKAKAAMQKNQLIKEREEWRNAGRK